jgi:soluble lytic murein transglycosylase
MPRVATYDENLAQPAQTTAARFAAPDTRGGVGGAIAAGLQKVGAGLADRAVVQDQIDEKLDDAGAKSIDNWLVPAAAKIRADFLAQQGLNAGAAKLATVDALNKAAKEALARATTPRMRRMAEEVVNARVAGWTGELDSHVANETRKADEIETSGRIDTSREEAIATTDPTARQANIDTMNAAIADRGGALGLGPEWVRSEQFKNESDIHSSIATNLIINEDIDGAVAYLDANKDKINGSDETRLRAMLKDPLERRDTDAYVDHYMGGATRQGGTTFSYADPLHGAGRAPVPGGQFNAARDYGGHKGADIPAPNGSAVYATGPGKVKVSRSELGGNIVTIDHGGGRVSRYMHLGTVKVKDGDTVSGDTQIGAVGMTGRSSGPHLHFEVLENGKAIDPEKTIGSVQQSPQRHDLNVLLAGIDKDPNLTPEQRDRYKQEVERRVSRDEQLQARVEQDAERKALDSVVRLGPDGFTSMSQLPADVRGSLSSSSQVTLMNMADSNAKARAAATRDLNLYNAMISGQIGGNPYDEHQKKAAEAAFKAKGGTADAALSIWQTTGILPKSGAAMLRGGLVSTNPDQIRLSANVAGNMIRRNPNAFAGVDGGEEIERAALAFNHYVTDLGMPPQQAAQRVAKENTPEFKSKVKITEPQVQAYRKALRQTGGDDAGRALGGGFRNPQAAAEANQSYAELVIDNLQNHYDLPTAQSMAAAQLKKMYAPTYNGKLEKYAPELAYPPINGSHGYVYGDARATVKKEAGVDAPNIRLFPIPGVTDDDIRNGRPPRYRIFYAHKGKDGQEVGDTLPGFFAADIAAAQKGASAKRQADFAAQRARVVKGQKQPIVVPDIPVNPGVW